jgi:predicted porin
MKKSLIALAVAGAFAAPAFAASSNVDFYGKFRISLDHLNNISAATGGWGMNDETSRIGFKGSEDLGGGLKAIYQWESGFNVGTNGNLSTGTTALTTGSGGLGAERNTFVGLSGGFGTVLAGRHDTPYKLAGSADLFGDTLADAQNGGALCIVCEDLRVNNAIAYVSPNMGGFTAIGAIVPGNFARSGATKSQNSLTDAYSLAGMYANGPVSVAAAYENLNHLVGAAAGSPSQKAFKLTGSFTIADVKLGATWEDLKDLGGVNGANSKNYLLSAAYGIGPITLAGQFGKRNANTTAGNKDLTDTTLGAVYSLSKRTSTYVGFAHYKPNSGSAVMVGADVNKSLNVWTFGMNHDF